MDFDKISVRKPGCFLSVLWVVFDPRQGVKGSWRFPPCQVFLKAVYMYPVSHLAVST